MLRRLARLLGTLATSLLLVEITVRVATKVPSVRDALPCEVGRDALCGLRTHLHTAVVHDDGHDPRRGWRNIPGRTAFGTVDAAGHRVHADPGAGRVGRPRVLLLGDSYTFGLEAADDETFAAGLAAARPDLEIVNLGVPGYGHDQMLLALDEEGPGLRPDVVVLGYVVLDVERNGLLVTSGPKPRFVEGDGDLVLEGVPVPKPTVWDRRVRWSWWTGALVAGLVEARTDPAPARAAVDRVTRTLLDRVAARTEALGARLVVVRLPTQPLHVPRDAQSPFAAPHALFDAWCAGRPAVCLDLLPAFRSVWDAGHDTTRGGHWTGEGHALVARALADALPGPTP